MKKLSYLVSSVILQTSACCSSHYLLLCIGMMSSLLSMFMVITSMVLLVTDHTWYSFMTKADLWLKEHRWDIKVRFQTKAIQMRPSSNSSQSISWHGPVILLQILSAVQSEFSIFDQANQWDYPWKKKQTDRGTEDVERNYSVLSFMSKLKVT